MALTKIDDRGLKTPIDLLDNEKIRFGTGNDLEIYHDGTDDVVHSTGTSLRTRSNIFRANNAANSAVLFRATAGGNFEAYYDGSKSFETTANGTQFDGRIGFTGTGQKIDLTDNQELRIGTGDDLIIKHDGSHSFVQNSTGELKLTSDTIRLQSTTGNELFQWMTKDGAVQLYYDDSKKLETNSLGIHVTGRAHIGHTTADPAPTSGSHTGNFLISNTDDNYGMQFGTRSSGKGWIQQTRVDGTATNYELQLQPVGGNVYMPDNGKFLWGTDHDLQLYHDGSNSRIHDAGTGVLAISGSQIDLQNAAQTETLIQAYQNGAVKLRYDNSVKLETTSTGVKITGTRTDIDTGGTEDCFRIGNAAGCDTGLRIGSTSTNTDTHGVIKYSKSGNWLSLLVSGEAHGAGGVLIANGGNVGIGTASPSHRLHVEGAASGVIAAKQTTNNGGYNTFEGKDSSGNVKFYASHNGRVGASEGIIFGSDTAASNVLDDYEEGTWTPVLKNGSNTISHTSSDGSTQFKYTKIGRLVHVIFCLNNETTSGTTGGSNTFQVEGLPFSPANERLISGPVLWYNTGLRINNECYMHLHTSGTAHAYMMTSPTGGYTSGGTQVEQVGSGSYMFWQLTYETS